MADRRRLLIIGYPLGHTLSPLMHNTALRELGLPFVYEAEVVRPEELTGAVRRFRSEGVAGFSVTIPHKEAIVPLLDSVEKDARLLGAVNTVFSSDGRFVGTNTDGIGFTRSLREDAGFDPKGRRLVVLGSGGAARAVAAYMALGGASTVVIANRTYPRAEKLAADLARAVRQGCFQPLPLEGDQTEKAVREADCLINTTSVGMAGDPGLPIPEGWIEPHQLVCDIVYRPLMTPLLRVARTRGASTLDGLGMLVYQGAEAFVRWTGVEMPVELVRSVLLKALEAESL